MNYDKIIILGFKRSGTSLLRVMLNSHPDIAIGPEIKFMEHITKNYPETFEAFLKVTKREATDFNFNEDQLHQIYNASNSAETIMQNWCGMYKNVTSKKIWGDKTPQNFKYLKLLSEKFPDALYVHIVRHPFSVMRSSKKRGHYHGLHTILGWFFSNYNTKFVKRKNYMFLRYEDFIKDPGYYTDVILEKLGVDKIDLTSIYRNYDHGRIAEGDSWNKEIIKENRDTEVLTAKDKLLIKTVCWFYFKKYKYN